MIHTPTLARRWRPLAALSVGLLAAGLMLAPMPAQAASPALPWDLNGDGYAELVVGARDESGALGEKHGVVTVLRGTATGPTTSGARVISQESPGVFGSSEVADGFGHGLASCDFNRDGYADLAISAQREYPKETSGLARSVGAVTVLYGSRSGLRTSGNDLFSPATFGLAGWWGAVECGDLNGDRYSDLVVGRACACPTVPTNLNGAPMVFYGAASGLDKARTLPLTPADAGAEPGAYDPRAFAARLAVGDLTADGIDDLVVGGLPEVFVFRGTLSGLSTTPMATLAVPSDRGVGALAIGDFDGNGYGDLALGGYTSPVLPQFCADLGLCPGAVKVIPSTATGLNESGARLWHGAAFGIQPEDNNTDDFGRALAAGDLNADGRDDLAMGIPRNDTGVTLETGAVAVVYGSPSGLSDNGADLWTQDSVGVPGLSEAGDRFGERLLIAKLRGHAARGLVIGIPFEDVGRPENAGAATVLFGRSSGLTTSGAKTWSQNSPGVPGAAELSDLFGGVGGPTG